MSTERNRLRAAIYARQSHGSERSIGEQITECIEDAESEGYRVVGTYIDTTGASRHARKPRPDHARLLADLEAGRLDVVVVWETSRADRRLTQWSELLDQCRDNGVLIRVTDDDETYDPRKPKHWERLASDGIRNAMHSEETRQRNLRTARHTAKNGGPNGPAPYGYLRDYRFDTAIDEDTGRQKQERVIVQTEDDDAGPIVREIFARIAAGEPVKTLADELADRGVPAPGQWRQGVHRWSPTRVRQIVRNRAYIGRRAHNGDPNDHKAIWPAIVDDETFWRAQRVLDDRAHRYFRAHRAEHVLSGVPRCGGEGCGGVFGGANSTQLAKTIYSCRTCGRSVDGQGLEDLVFAYTLGRLARDDVYSRLRRAGEDADAEVLAARAEADRLRARLDSWRAEVAAAVAGGGDVPSAATMAAIEDDLTRKIKASEQRAERAGIPPPVRDLLEDDPGSDLAQRWARMPLAARRDVIAALVDVTVKPGRRGGRMPVDERVTVAWKGAAS